MIDLVIEDFKTCYPTEWRQTIKYWENSPYELCAKLEDDRIIIFDHIDKTIRRLPQDSNHMTEQEFRKEFGIRLRRLMWYKGVTQESLSKATGISQTMISKYITGSACPSFSNVDKICRALRCSVDRLRYIDGSN